MEDANGKELAAGNIVTVQFEVIEFDRNCVVLQPITAGESGLPGKVAIEPRNVIFLAENEDA